MNEMQTIRIQDVMPTMAGLMGIPVAKNLDGKPQIQFFTPELNQLRPIQWIDEYDFTPPAENVMTDKSVENVIRHELRSLGYIE